MPRMPFSGVRISCDDHRQEARLGAVGGLRLIARFAERAFRHHAVGDIAADALDFGLAAFAAHQAFAPGDPARAGRRFDLLVVHAPAVGQHGGFALFEDVEARNPSRSGKSRSRPASAQKASLTKVMTPSRRRRTIRSPCDSRKARERCSASCKCQIRSDNCSQRSSSAPRAAAPDAVAVDQERHEGAGEGKQRRDPDRKRSGS